MRRRIAVILVTVLATMTLAMGASAATPCDGAEAPGNSDYAKHHISALAKTGDLGNPNSGLGHRPGTHSGFSICL